MGQTLTYGVYLPDEGERNCYSGLAQNWQILDDAVGAIAGKANASHTHGNITNDGAIGSTAGLPIITGTDGVLTTGSFGNTAGTFCEGNDSRLSDARTPVAHTHTKSDITDLFNSANTWSANQMYTGILALSSSSDVAEQFIHKLPKDVTVSTDALVRFSTLQDSAGHYIVTNTEGHWTTYVSKSTTLKYQNDSTKQGTIDFRLYSSGKGLIYPQSPFECDLGNSSNQWNNIYAKGYYYNGTAWGLNVKNIWTHFNVINGYRFEIKQASQEIGVLPSSNQWNGFNFVDKNEQNTVSFQHAFLPAESRFSISMVDNVASHDSNSTVWIEFLRMTAYSGGSGFIVGAELRPSNNNLNLGNSTNKWKTLNGVNPGALSLPDYSQVENIKNISNMTFDGATGNLIQTASQTSNTFEDSGYLIVKLKNSSVGDYVTIKCQQNNIALSADDYPQFRTTCVVAGETIGLVVPVAEGQQPYIFATKQPTTFKFVKCYGNV